MIIPSFLFFFIIPHVGASSCHWLTLQRRRRRMESMENDAGPTLLAGIILSDRGESKWQLFLQRGEVFDRLMDCKASQGGEGSTRLSVMTPCHASLHAPAAVVVLYQLVRSFSSPPSDDDDQYLEEAFAVQRR